MPECFMERRFCILRLITNIFHLIPMLFIIYITDFNDRRGIDGNWRRAAK